MNTKLWAAFLVALGLASPASATLVNVTYTGTVYDGYDDTGVFGGPAYGKLNGAAYTLVYTRSTRR